MFSCEIYLCGDGGDPCICESIGRTGIAPVTIYTRQLVFVRCTASETEIEKHTENCESFCDMAS